MPEKFKEEPVIKAESATEADISGILAVQEGHWLLPKIADGISEEELKEKGFLVHKLQKEELNDFLKNPNAAVIVCKQSGEVIGYSIGYTLEEQLKMHPDWLDTIEFIDPSDRSRLEQGKFWYARQVAIAAAMQGRGIQRELRRSMLQVIQSHGCTSTLGEILDVPIHNDASFRTLRGYAKVIGNIPDDYEGTHYVWALVETPLV